MQPSPTKVWKLGCVQWTLKLKPIVTNALTGSTPSGCVKVRGPGPGTGPKIGFPNGSSTVIAQSAGKLIVIESWALTGNGPLLWNSTDAGIRMFSLTGEGPV